MSHIVHPRKQFKSINTFEKSYDYIMTLGEEKNHYLLLEN